MLKAPDFGSGLFFRNRKRLVCAFPLPCLPKLIRRGIDHELTMIYPGEIPVNPAAILVRGARKMKPVSKCYQALPSDPADQLE